jgi:hypothetical protein
MDPGFSNVCVSFLGDGILRGTVLFGVNAWAN